MRIVITGGGKVGGFLARELSEAGHVVTVIEQNPDLARRLGESLSALVLHGDGTDVTVLREAEVGRADWLLAVTGLDEENLVACELAQTLGVGRVLARLNNPRNHATFDALGLPVVAVTDLIARVISREVDLSDFERVAVLGRGKLSLMEVEIQPGTPKRLVAGLALPPDTILVARVRGADAEVPGAYTMLAPGDRVLAVTTVEQEAVVRNVLCPSDG